MRKAAPLMLLFLLSISFAGSVWEVRVDGPAYTKPLSLDSRIIMGTGAGTVYGIEGGSIKWNQKLEGAAVGDPALLGSSAVVAAGNRVYGINSAGGILWSYAVSGPRGVAGSDKAYVSHSGGIVALDSSGKAVWAYNASLPTEPSAEVAGYVVFGAERKVVVLRSTGERFWEREVGPFWNARPHVWSGTVYTGTSEGDLYALDLYSGEEQWVYRTGDMVTSTPAHAGAYIIFGTANGHVYAINNGQLAWELAVDGMVEGEIVVDGSVIYLSTRKSLYGISASDGSILMKRQFPDWPHSPSVIGGSVVLGTEEGKVYAIDSSRACSILSPGPDELVGDAEVKVEGKSYSKYGGVQTFLRVQGGEWTEVGGEEWEYTLDPSIYPYGVVMVECYVSDSAGMESSPFNGIQLVKGAAPKPKMKVTYPTSAKEGEPFTISVEGPYGEPLGGVSARVGGETFRGDGEITITPRVSGRQSVNVTKTGYEDAVFSVDVKSQPTLAYIVLFIAVLAAAAYAYFGYIKKEKPATAQPGPR